jgi:CheY-like chemotaxis protein
VIWLSEYSRGAKARRIGSVISPIYHPVGLENTTGSREVIPHSTRRKVLIVDDQEPIRELMRFYLEREGCEIHEAGSGPEALLLFTHGGWDVVITDRVMPSMSGDELAANIRRLDRNVPIVLVSGSVDPQVDTFRFDAVLPKPFSKQVLVRTLERLLPRIKAA